MEHIGIETAQNVVVHQEVANLGDRIVAYILDTLVLVVWIFICVFLVVASAVAWENPVAIGFFMVVALLPYMFYHLICEITMDGQSIGKRAKKIKVASVDGGQPRLGQYLLRWVLRPIDGFYYLGLVVVLINGKGQRLGDLAAGTTVVSLKPRMRLQDTLMTEVKAEHVVRFPEAVRLNDAQASMIKEVLNNTQVKDRWTLMEEMATKVRTVIGNPGEGMKAMDFLRAVLQDYVYLTGQQGAKP
ncbi:MAG: RDD family protein [Flavobacteriales bacterium]|nr:RDD family protein [Flavobacteriales bacterium]